MHPRRVPTLCAWFDDTGSTREMTLAWRPRQYRRRVKVCDRESVPVCSSGTDQLPPNPRVNDRRALVIGVTPDVGSGTAHVAVQQVVIVSVMIQLNTV